jgi:hypothetical protein
MRRDVGRSAEAANVAAIEFPALVLTDRAKKFACAYSAEDRRELEACPLHTYVRTGRLQSLRLFDSRGRCFTGGATEQWRLDTAFIRDVGPVIWFVALIVSGLDVVLRFDMAWQEMPSQ